MELRKLAPVAAHWVVVGAGPCGVAAVGTLCDSGLAVTWVDAGGFSCGRMGQLYRSVPANTPNGSFVNAFRSRESFCFDWCQARRRLRRPGEPTLSDLDPDRCADLGVFVDALEDSVQVLQGRVGVISGTAVALHGERRGSGAPSWALSVTPSSGAAAHMKVSADAVILCPGSRPATPCSASASLDAVMDPLRLSALLAANPSLRAERWAVVGHSHSGMLALKNLVEAGIPRIISVYRSEIRYFSTSDGFIKYQGSGLKGPVAAWCREHILSAGGGYRWVGGEDVVFVRADPRLSAPQQVAALSVRPECAVFAVGFERQTLQEHGLGTPPVFLAGEAVDTGEFDASNGMIAGIPSLFGAGIAYPHNYANSDGLLEPWVGFGFGTRNAQAIVDTWRRHTLSMQQ